jgi:hypothetical protein
LTTVLGLELQRFGDRVPTAMNDHHNVRLHVGEERADGIACPPQRSEGGCGSAGLSVVAGYGDVEFGSGQRAASEEGSPSDQ